MMNVSREGCLRIMSLLARANRLERQGYLELSEFARRTATRLLANLLVD